MVERILPSIALLLAIPVLPVSSQRPAERKAGASVASKVAPPCDASGKDQITIACDYSRARDSASGAEPRIVLTHVSLSFQPADESHMHVELTFKNGGSKRISEARQAYLAVDDDAGQNYVRRVLPQVDFRKLAPNQSLTFSEVLLVGALQPGRYSIHLWIPSSDPALKFDVSKSLLLRNEGVADPYTGLNTLAAFTVTR